MNQYKNAAKEYLERQVHNASPAERVVLTYDGAIRFLMNARRAIEQNNIEARFINCKKATDIITYLMETLDMEQGGEISQNLSRIYSYMLRRLVDVNIKNAVEPIDEVIAQLRQLRSSWEKIARGEAQGYAQDDARGGAQGSRNQSETDDAADKSKQNIKKISATA